MQGNPPAEHLVTWIKQKHLEEIALFFLNAHEPVLNIVKQTGIACSFLVPLPPARPQCSGADRSGFGLFFAPVFGPVLLLILSPHLRPITSSAQQNAARIGAARLT